MTVRIINADVMDGLAQIDSESVHCVVTSPPYFGLRDYGTATWQGGDPDCDHSPEKRGGRFATPVSGKQASNNGSGTASRRDCPCGATRIDKQIGLEPTPDAYVAKLVEVFREVRRVLRKDGTCWLNLGDSYAATTKGSSGVGKNATNKGTHLADRSWSIPPGLKPKDLIGIPWNVAFSLRYSGWWLRQDIIWSKPNPMPESVTDRCTKAHEYIFLLTKAERYFYDAEAIAEPLAYGSVERLSQPTIEQQEGSARVPGKTNGNMKSVYKKPYENKSTKDYAASGAQDASATKARIVDRILAGEIVTRNKRSVWEVTTQPFPEAHFATFPPALIEPCIKAGCPEGGTVLDPFGGSGTTGLVADRLKRNAILIELNPEYAAMSERRIKGDCPMFAEVGTSA